MYWNVEAERALAAVRSGVQERHAINLEIFQMIGDDPILPPDHFHRIIIRSDEVDELIRKSFDDFYIFPSPDGNDRLMSEFVNNYYDWMKSNFEFCQFARALSEVDDLEAVRLVRRENQNVLDLHSRMRSQNQMLMEKFYHFTEIYTFEHAKLKMEFDKAERMLSLLVWLPTAAGVVLILVLTVMACIGGGVGKQAGQNGLDTVNNRLAAAESALDEAKRTLAALAAPK